MDLSITDVDRGVLPTGITDKEVSSGMLHVVKTLVGIDKLEDISTSGIRIKISGTLLFTELALFILLSQLLSTSGSDLLTH